MTGVIKKDICIILPIIIGISLNLALIAPSKATKSTPESATAKKPAKNQKNNIVPIQQFPTMLWFMRSSMAIVTLWEQQASSSNKGASKRNIPFGIVLTGQLSSELVKNPSMIVITHKNFKVGFKGN